jgi:hypothetical protein
MFCKTKISSSNQLFESKLLPAVASLQVTSQEDDFSTKVHAARTLMTGDGKKKTVTGKVLFT